MFFAQGVLTIDAVWVKSTVEYNSLTKQLANTKLQQTALAIVDSNGYFIKRPPTEIIGYTQRVYTDGLQWLTKNSKTFPESALHQISDKRTLSTLQYDSVRQYISYLSSNSPFDQPNFKAFLNVALPKGLPSLL